jgi:hypothetical protein
MYLESVLRYSALSVRHHLTVETAHLKTYLVHIDGQLDNEVPFSLCQSLVVSDENFQGWVGASPNLRLTRQRTHLGLTYTLGFVDCQLHMLKLWVDAFNFRSEEQFVIRTRHWRLRARKWVPVWERSTVRWHCSSACQKQRGRCPCGGVKIVKNVLLQGFCPSPRWA